MPVQAPQSFKAGRTLKIGATTYQPGAVVPNASVKNLGNLSALLGSGDLVPDRPLRSGTNRAKVSTPFDISPGLRKKIP
jgi:hypothetical protein